VLAALLTLANASGSVLYLCGVRWSCANFRRSTQVSAGFL